ncbi:hypothetical protein B296_00010342 [Ensete ventricosum]|uniref:BHLH domain-containing protein n=1 Tax=Ensete ventricosum TaxID=4639 RepID=A0A427AUG3_ENSVE|nr:hypothetical protein B296_00010342 [Ensete ventricosum]
MMPLQTKKTKNCEQQVYPSAPAQIADTEQEFFGRGYVHMSRGNEEIHASKSTWSQVLPALSPNSCITTSFSTNVLTTFSSKADQLPETSSEVRKEKLGERITALHQIISPFGKLVYDVKGNQPPPLIACTLSFVPGQMQILNENGMKKSGEQDQECNDERKKDLRSRGLCLVPVAFMMHVGSGNGADLWAPALGGGFH